MARLHSAGFLPGRPILYGLPKIHKANVPLRPILSYLGCHNFKLSQYAVKLLKPLIKNSHIVKDGYNFIKEINQVVMKPSYIMASYDVESLFTNTPVQETIYRYSYTASISCVLGLEQMHSVQA